VEKLKHMKLEWVVTLPKIKKQIQNSSTWINHTGSAEKNEVLRSWIQSIIKAWFSYVGKIPDDRRFYCFQTVPDFADYWKLEIADIPDRLGWTGTNLENRERFYWPDASQISAMGGDHSGQMKTQICTVGVYGAPFVSKLIFSLVINI